MNTVAVAETLGAIRDSLIEAKRALDDPEEDASQREIMYFLNLAFLQTQLFLEAHGLPRILSIVEQLHDTVKKNHYEPCDVWVEELWLVCRAIEATFGGGPGSVTKEIVEILRATQYAITDRECFAGPPDSESAVHVRIEAVLRCVFPDLLTKPQITKPIKNFVPDTGLPSVRTLIEYKFIESRKDAKRVGDEILADTRGYVSKEWHNFIYVVYETRRVKRESEWEQLMRASGVGDSTRVIVISGEEPSRKRGRQTHWGKF
jgi:hypothetical protein